MTVRIGSYAALERPGRGHRAAGSVIWRGEDINTGSAVLLLVLPAESAAEVAERVEAVADITHPHLLTVDEVVFSDEHVAAVCPWPRGGRLLELVVRRGPLTPEETLTVLIPIASALTEVHARDVRHGGVGAGSVWFDEQGRPRLGALAVSRIVADHQHGMPADSRDVAPEVVRGERSRHEPISSSADVFSLGSVALFCLTGRSAWPADDPADVLIQSAAGAWPDLPDDAGPAALVGLVRRMLRAQPDERPSAAESSQELSAMGPPAPIAFGSRPAPAGASADRWGGEQTGASRTPVSRTASRTASRTTTARTTAARAAYPGRAVRALRPAPPNDRHQRPTRPARAAIAFLATLLVGVVVIQMWVWSGDSDGLNTSAAEPPAATEQDWSQVVAELDAARGRAFEAADPALLDEVDAGGSSAADADAAAIAELVERGWHVAGGGHLIDSVTLMGPVSDEAVRLAVRDSLPSYPVLDASGTQVGVTPARDVQERIVVLTSTTAGYRIGSVTTP